MRNSIYYLSHYYLHKSNVNNSKYDKDKQNNLDVSCYQPFIGFEPMTYALPWRYSTTELKGLMNE